MSFFRCPVCGLLKSARSYSPEGFDDGITLVYMSGRGRGKGFEVVGEEPLEEGSELHDMLSARIRALDEAFNHRDQPDKEDQLDRVEELVHELEEARDEAEELVDLINDALMGDEEYDDLPEAVQALIDEYLDLQEEARDLIEE